MAGMSVNETTATMTANASHTPSMPLEGVRFLMCSPEYTKADSEPANESDMSHSGSDWLVNVWSLSLRVLSIVSL